MHKKGVSGLEFILAFVLFAGFTVAALYFFNPVRSLKNMDYSRDYTLSKIIENTSVELDVYSIIILEGVNDEKISVKISGINLTKKVSAVDYNGIRVDASRGEEEIFCFGKPDERFVTLYFSEDITKSDSLIPCLVVNE